jgi:hypothetical protein
MKYNIYSKLYPKERILWQGKSFLADFLEWTIIYLIILVIFSYIVLSNINNSIIIYWFLLILFLLLLIANAFYAFRFPYYSITTHRIIITTYRIIADFGDRIEERSLPFSASIKKIPLLKEEGKRVKLKLGEGYIQKVELKNFFLDLFGRKSIVITTSNKKQNHTSLNYFIYAVSSPFIIKGIKDAENVINIIKKRIK